jgi:phage tail-like protein
MDTMPDNTSGTRREANPLHVDHAANVYRCYPGERVAFYTRVGVQQPVHDLAVKITIPDGLRLTDYRVLLGDGDAMPAIEYDLDACHLTWNVGTIQPGSQREYLAEAQVAPISQDLILESRATAYLQEFPSPLRQAQGRPLRPGAWKGQEEGRAGAKSPSPAGGGLGRGQVPLPAGGRAGEGGCAEETVSIAILAKAQYLKHLPALYQTDPLMSRFLMLFESFWGPIHGQIDHLPFYFDPKMTPPDFLPWLASWFNVVLDERLSEQQQRRLIGSLGSLYRKRGTKHGLEEYLEIYTGRSPQIIEHRARDFRLGQEARLGPGVALGTGNRPHSFTVVLCLPPLSDPDGDEKACTRRESERRRAIEAIIEAEKPAHTAYTLHLTQSQPG